MIPAYRYSDGAKQSDFSNVSQRDELEQEVKLNCSHYNFPFESETAHSGRDWDRKQLEDLLDSIKRYNRRNSFPITLVLFHRWDRFFREAIAAVSWVHRFREIGVEINAAKQWVNFDEHTDLYRLFIELLGAEKVSRDIGEHTIRRQKAKLRRGLYPYQLSKRYYYFEQVGEDKYVRFHPARKNLGDSMRAIIRANGELEAAHEMTGGVDVHGPYSTWRDQLVNVFHQARYKEYELHFDPIVSESEWRTLQGILSKRKVVSAKNRRIYNNPLNGLIRIAPCGGSLSNSPVTKKLSNGKKKTYNYSICACKPVRHFRMKQEEMLSHFHDMLSEISITAEKRVEVEKAIKRQLDSELKGLRQEERKLRKELQRAQLVEQNAAVARFAGEAGADEVKIAMDYAANVKADFDQNQRALAEAQELAKTAVDTLDDVKALIVQGADPFQTRDFIRMAFPEGLIFHPKNRIFTTVRINHALDKVVSESNGYGKIKFGPTSMLEAGPARGGRPELSRTIQSKTRDLILYNRYRAKYG